MEQNELPCIVQALPASVEHQHFEVPCIVQALPAFKRDVESSLKRDASTSSPQSISKRAKETFTIRDGSGTTSSPQVPASSRCTRSQAAPDWTTHETLILVNEIAAVDEGWFRALSSYQKWKIISDNCMESDVIRSSNQCKRRWQSLLADYRKIREWESRSGAGSYWHFDGERRKELGLPVLFDQEIFDSMDAFIKAEEAQKSMTDCDTENLTGGETEAVIVTANAELLDADAALDSEEDRKNDTQGSSSKAWELAGKLHANSEHIHSILRGELKDSASCNHALVDLSKPNAMETEFARRQADELIKAFGGLVTTLNQFSELIKDGGVEGVGAMK
ncbi:uncharacterized protein [Typha latifolia]|uniref:uncharacterized protein n=1 Tax=Typha latifolia TaxID=4733 RepID=UPI003C2ABDB1